MYIVNGQRIQLRDLELKKKRDLVVSVQVQDKRERVPNIHINIVLGASMSD